MTTRHVLIADGEPKVAFLLREALERSNRNYRVSVAHSGVEALEVFRRSPVDLLVTDQWMPDISGLELISWVREYSPHTCTVFVSANGRGGVEAKDRRLGISRCLTRPFDANQFIETVQEALPPSSEEQALANGLQAREQLISLVFHELRTPLTHVMGYAEFLAEQSKGPHREWLQIIQRYTRRMREVLDDVTLMAEWSIRWASAHPQPTNLRYVLEAAVTQLTALVMEKHQTLQLAPMSEPIWITADAWLLGMLFNALASNAIKRAPVRGRIYVSARREGETAVVTVKGSSDGVSDERTATDEPCIGLTVARKLAESLSGRLQIESGAGNGTIFRLIFPIYHPPEEAWCDARAGGAKGADGRLSGGSSLTA